MPRHLPTRRAILAASLSQRLVSAKANRAVLESFKSMEATSGLAIALFSDFDPLIRRWRRTNPYGSDMTGGLAVSPDGAEVCWGVDRKTGKQPSPFLVVQGLNRKSEPIWLDGRQCTSAIGISSGSPLVVVKAIGLLGRNRWALLALDRSPGMTVRDLASFLKRLEVADIEHVSVSASGTLVALGSRTQIEVLEVPSGNSVLGVSGWIPKLSPDGRRLAFVDKERLHVRSLADGSTETPHSGTRVTGVGGWSPDGKYLLAGAWVRTFALEKRQIVLDATTWEYAEIGKLHDGDYGNYAVWVSEKLITQ
jgi:WD40 repeat protein